jgi:hypothetical protein
MRNGWLAHSRSADNRQSRICRGGQDQEILASADQAARSRAEVDNSIPIALAVLRLIVNFAFMDFISL